MCQVFAINNLKKVENFEYLTNVIKEAITVSNRHGFGMAVHNELGISAFKTVDYNVSYDPEMFEKIRQVVKTSDFEYIGQHTFERPLSAIFHGRTSTNKTGLRNAHPIMLNNQCVVHNGVVSVKTKYKQVLDTDSELLTTIQDDLKHNLEKKVTGYYAFLNLLTDGSIQIVRDKIASLVMGYCPEIDSHIFATDEELLNSVITEMEWTIKSIHNVKDEIVFTISPDNIVRSVQEFKSLGYGKKHLKLAKTSLGRVIDPWDTEATNAKNDYYGMKDLETMAKEIVLKEFKYADASWAFYSDRHELKLSEFEALSDDQKLECFVTDWQGTEISVEQTMLDLEKDEEFFAS